MLLQTFINTYTNECIYYLLIAFNLSLSYQFAVNVVLFIWSCFNSCHKKLLSFVTQAIIIEEVILNVALQSLWNLKPYKTDAM